MEDNSLVINELDPIEKRIGTSETNSIEARWEFGRVLLKHHVGKQLPRGMRAAITEQFRLEPSEITRRTQLAEKFATREEVVDACTRCGSWRRLIREELVKNSRVRAEKPWGESAKVRLDRLAKEAGESDDRRDELVALLRDALRTLGGDVVEAAA